MNYLLLIPVMLAFLAGCTTATVTEQDIQASAENLDYGDYTSHTLTARAWDAFGKKDYPVLFAYADKIVELYGEEGKRMNAEMTDFEPRETAAKKWALNDVGTALWMKAKAYVDMKMYPQASKTWSTLANDFTYTQCWDPKGWYWRPAEGAAYNAKRYNIPQ